MRFDATAVSKNAPLMMDDLEASFATVNNFSRLFPREVPFHASVGFAGRLSSQSRAAHRTIAFVHSSKINFQH